MADRGSLGTLFRYELKMLLRDKRTIFFSVVLPLILLPGLFLIMRFTERQAEERRESRTYEYAVVGPDAELARELIAAARALPGDTAEAEPMVEVALADAVVEVDPADPDSALAAGEIDFVVEGLGAEAARALRDSLAGTEAGHGGGEGTERGTHGGAQEPSPGSGGGESGEADEPGRAVDDEEVEAALSPEVETAVEPAVPLIRLRFRGDSDESETGAARMRDRLQELREHRRNAAYRVAGLPVDPEAVASVELEEAATAERASGAQLALWLTPLLVMLMLSGGSVVAADAISGEKERGTLETLLTTSVRRREIVNAKQLMIIVVGVAITLINISELALFLGLGLFELPERFVISMSPTAVVLLLLLFLPLTVLISSVLLMLSGYAKSYKEYQIYFFPVLVIFLLPSAAALLPGLELASVVSIVPLANIAVAVREVLVGEYDWPFLALTFLSTVALAAWLARLTERTLSTEKLITAAELDEADLVGGPALFPRRVLRWFAVLWVVFFLSSLWFVGELEIRGQVTFNVIGLFGGASLLMLWRYRLDPRKALALRMPRPAVWLAVLLGAPSAFITGIGIGQISQYVLPVSDEMLEAFGQFMLPEALPLWQVVLFLAIVPGVFEEIAFRGVLLHGLRRRFRPVVLAIVVGAIFGFFHVDLYRFVPVTYLGFLLAGVTLLTGSIYPAILWHALNNAVALVPAHLGWLDGVDQIPVWLYPVGVAGLLAAFALVWFNRTPYPGLAGRRAVPGSDRLAGAGRDR
jgi:sodium transport system permease protein